MSNTLRGAVRPVSFRIKSKQMNTFEVEPDYRGDCCVKDGASDYNDGPFVPSLFLPGRKDYLEGSHEDVRADGEQYISHFQSPVMIPFFYKLLTVC